ncbi:MAG: heme-binding domain-containing protein [Armatimonadota bacterium]|nr:heme-binding domain-containing protein [Armatimonadota bacterium]MDR7451520.1 heme-binding domain-containing protein [Armatimonadota bacterium]MDR7467487.1 heme-binding domain-containing protein [Armatimonadota bacterium]MDR7494361.1 heme-binding domain-containing protein [Armatimonadota bacterium]MDR7499178.1 heme-binding domain-containing protein [Armatimonadota bacterium]
MRWGVVVLLLAAVAIQVLPYGRVHTNPPVVAEPRWDSPRTRALFLRACGDCHSHLTVWPWYSHIAPVSWWIARDVREGRKEFNVSTWGATESEGDDAAEVVRAGRMPPRLYVLLRPAAQLSAGDTQDLIRGLDATFGGERPQEEDGPPAEGE